VATAGKGAALLRFVLLILGPSMSCEAKSPDIVQFLIFFVFPTENNKKIFIENGRMASTGLGLGTCFRNYFLPFLGGEMEPI
jgi:hypothetical protein